MHYISLLTYTLCNKLFPGKFNEASFIISIKNIQWIGVSKVFSMIISFVTTAIVARHFGPENFGTLNYALSFVGIFAVFATLGVSSVVYRELVKSKERREEILGSAIFLTFIASLLTIISISIYLYYSKESSEMSLLIFLASLTFITQPLSLLQIDFLKDSEARYVTINQLITSFAANAGKIFVVISYGSVWIFIAILVAENVLSGIIYTYQITRIKKRAMSLKISFPLMKSIFYSALPYAVSLSFMDIYARIDQVMLKHYLDVSSVGLYAAATKVTELWYFIPNIIITGLYPVLANKDMTEEKRRKRFIFLLQILFVVSLIISFVVFLLKDYIIKIIYGVEFIAASPILAIYIFSLAGTFTSLLILQELFIKERNWSVVLIPGGNAILNIVLNLFLIPLYGVYGAAVATVISYNLIPLVYYLTKK